MYVINTRQQGLTDLFLEVSRDNVYGASFVHKFGRVTGVSASVANDIWGAGGGYQFPTAACIVKIESSASSDASGNEGAKTITLSGLNVNYDEVTETISLAGRDIVDSANSYLRLHRMKVLTAGSMSEAQGNITASHVDTGTIAQINQGFNQTLMAIFTIPASRTGYLYQWTASVDRDGTTSDKGGDLKIQFREIGSVFQTKDTLGLLNFAVDRMYPMPMKIPEKTDIKMQASAAGQNTAFSATFDLLILDNHI